MSVGIRETLSANDCEKFEIFLPNQVLFKQNFGYKMKVFFIKLCSAQKQLLTSKYYAYRYFEIFNAVLKTKRGYGKAPREKVLDNFYENNAFYTTILET